MSLTNTNLQIQMAQLPATFSNTPQQFAIEMVRRMKIVSPNGTNFIFIGDVEPTSNVGPWLKGGTQWFVWDESIKRYVPLDISASETKWYWIGASTPPNSTPPVWMRTSKDATVDDPSYGEPRSWLVFNGATWETFVGIVESGPTSARPSAPENYQQFYDTDITSLLWFERAKWRTVSGVPGDVKPVAFLTLTDALTHNPGWSVLGAANVAIRGRWVMQAGKDPGATPETTLTMPPGVANRAAFETFGETDGVKIDATSPVPYPPSLALWWLTKE